VFRKFAIIFVVPLFIHSAALAGELYQAQISNKSDAKTLTATGAEPILRVSNGYLVICDSNAASALERSGLTFRKLDNNISRDEIAIGRELGPQKTQPYPLLFEEDEVRLYRVVSAKAIPAPEISGLFPLMTENLIFEYREPVSLNLKAFQPDIPLDSVINLVKYDSLVSYVFRLQAFYRRYAGTDSNYVSRDWIAAKLASFGYDSIVIDSFAATIAGVPKNCQNVLAYKIGTEYPNHHIIVGAHRDAVSTSPGADDNGSGTAGVLEIARILKDIPTKTTFIFALFDAEEQGLLGSWHYVNEAKPRGDSIVYMLNMDMIAHITNTDKALLHHGTDTTYSFLWIDLADSLVGLTGYLAGSSGSSDHYPFVQNGYPATFVFEYDFADSVYHSPRDSTTYMNFTYMTKMAQASAATVYVASETFAPTGEIVFEFPQGVPKMILPGKDTTFDVVVSGSYDKAPLPGSGRLFYSFNGGAFVEIPMTEISADHYSATIPEGNCFDHIEYFIRVGDTAGGLYYSPLVGESYKAVIGTEEISVFADNFESNLGWTAGGSATAGQWGRGIPAGGGDRGDPPTDYDGSGRCYLTGNYDGDSDVDGGTVTLTSPTFDLSTGDALIQYARWYSNNSGSNPYSDTMFVYISNDEGANWTRVETVGPVEQSSGGWFVHSFWTSQFVAPTSTMKLRFDASDLGGGSVVEAAVDDIHIWTYECVDYVCGDASGNDVVNALDITYLINFLYKAGAPPNPPEAGDADGSGIINALDVTYLINYLYKGGAGPICP
jgi:hypothetical protein